ncbi:putative acyl-activating enzyme 19 isoform X9 [Neltuma alba]|uniref:putative acyl-activating enzyme 19 isoform X9 n=1 Tax=Neltuma alba TaxID=207710 RepID=UPI0010A3FD28|nr:putative acyl-activating enzyme 19 isoform X9 [Prosopis alba]XP_028801193.1 putative acyl-activating enzyme 19 isoform X9 [Prosopis alba]
MSNENTKEEAKYCCISHEFFRAASANPDKIAVIHASGAAQVSMELHENSTSSIFGRDIVESFDKLVKSISPPMYSGDSCYTYSDMLEAVHSLSSRLRSILLGGDDPHLIRPKAQANDDVDGVEGKIIVPRTKTVSAPGTEYRPKIVGIYMSPSVEYIVAVLSVLRSGEAFLPLDPFWPYGRIQSVVSSSKADLIIKSRSSFGKGNSGQLDDSHWAVHSSSCAILNFSMEENLPECTADLAWPCENDKKRSFCYLMYTSGSTGKPKGVCGTEQGLLNRFSWMQQMYPLDGQDVLLFKSSISFVDHLQEFLSATLTACVLVIPPFCEMKDNAYSLINFIQAYFINRLTAVPSLMRTILPGLQNHSGMRVQSSLKLLVLSGENFPLTLWKMLSAVLPNTSILNLYGSTEVSGDCTYFDCKRMPLILKSEMLSTVPIGMPISNCDVLLLGEKDASNEGELYVGGSCIARGYHAVPNLLSDDFVELPQNYGCRDSVDSYQKRLYYRTGDLAKKLPTGDFIFLGRNDRIIKVNGQRIALEEIENLLREHPDINDAAVICQNNQGELVLLEAFIILKEAERAGELLIPSIRSWMTHNLPSILVPNDFIFTQSFPVTASGKVNYELLTGSTLFTKHFEDEVGSIGCSNLLQVVKKGDGSIPWCSSSIFLPCSISRCNKVLFKEQPRITDTHQTTWSLKVPRSRRGHMKDLWKVYMESCVDASPMLVFRSSEIYLFIGSHSCKFLCINARSGSVQWETKLEGRVECSAAIVCDFSQVVVGCYRGKIYFLDFSNGNTYWSFQTSGEVKSQPVVDTSRQLIWMAPFKALYGRDLRSTFKGARSGPVITREECYPRGA